MEQNEIKLLLEKYWKAETTIEEEKAIKKYLATHQDKSLEEENGWFNAIEQMQGIGAKPAQQNFKKKAGYASVLTKIAASVIVVTAIVLWGISHHNRAQAEKDIAAKKQVEADLKFIAEALDQGYDNLNESKDILLDIKPLNVEK